MNSWSCVGTLKMLRSLINCTRNLCKQSNTVQLSPVIVLHVLSSPSTARALKRSRVMLCLARWHSSLAWSLSCLRRSISFIICALSLSIKGLAKPVTLTASSPSPHSGSGGASDERETSPSHISSLLVFLFFCLTALLLGA